MTRAVLWAGGWAHPGHDQIAAVEQLTASRGIELSTVTDPLEAPASIRQGCDVLIVSACWFSMTDARYNVEQRADYAVEFGPELQTAVRNLRAAGRPLLALHTAAICFDGAEGWRNWLGGAWNWDTSWHPDPELIDVVPTASTETGLSFERFAVVDELYQSLDVAPSVDVVARSAAGDPLVWLHDTAQGRAAVNLLGHDRRSLQTDAHRGLNQQLLDWLLASKY